MRRILGTRRATLGLHLSEGATRSRRHTCSSQSLSRMLASSLNADCGSLPRLLLRHSMCVGSRYLFKTNWPGTQLSEAEAAPPPLLQRSILASSSASSAPEKRSTSVVLRTKTNVGSAEIRYTALAFWKEEVRS